MTPAVTNYDLWLARWNDLRSEEDNLRAMLARWGPAVRNEYLDELRRELALVVDELIAHEAKEDSCEEEDGR
jgi:hypothetical protein